MNTPIRGKVAYVLNNGDIVINVGRAHGVHRGMYFDVIDDHNLEIRDPDTQEVIGSLEVSKIKVEVIDTQEKISVATPHLPVKRKGGDSYRVSIPLGPFARSLMPPSWVAEDAISRSEKDSNVEVGNSVVEFIGEIYPDNIDRERIAADIEE